MFFTMKNLLFALFLLPLLATKCGETDHPAAFSDGKEITYCMTNCQIYGNHAYISIGGNTIDQNYWRYVLPTILEFESEKKVRVTSYTPEIDKDSEDLRGVWVTFEPITQ
jgi:hypothetical protein